jgi:digeranylgeranylglycerophospholipid reductase
MQPSYDVVVVGAGPAGSVAARKFAEAGLRVLLIEKRQEIGAPVRCAEAIGVDSTRAYIDIDNRWVDATITRFAVYNAVGECVVVPPTETTLIVNRKVFDWELAHLAAKAGAKVRTRSQATGLLRDNGQVTGVRMHSLGKAYEVQARLVIAADGTESQVARWAGLATVPPMADFYVGYQYLLANLKGRIDPTLCQYHMGYDIAPGGYVWVFPKGEDTANVGLVISANNAKNISAQQYLDNFVARYYPGSSILGVVAGGIPAAGALKKMVTGGVMTVGDAAHQADPLTAGGINLGMIAADMAAQVGVKALANGDLSAKALSEYETLWQDRFGAQHKTLYQIRKILTDMDSARLIALIHTASQLPLEDMSLGQILVALLRHHPRLLLESRKLITSGLILK